ncbi:MAG: MBL fold metallo-hydrolase [Phycisphaerae bacterium]|nr:MBL fold metallo-hydrolase [Phycisphaerae bacterium]
MKATMKFLGAAQNVTGSRHLLEVDGIKLLIDCGMYQERQFLARNWEPFDKLETIDAVLLTHAHLDHCGLLPRFVQQGFSGPIYSTPATAEIARIILMDSARLQEEDAAYKRKRHEKQGRTGPHDDLPLYTVQDAEQTFPLFSPVNYKQPIKFNDHVSVSFYNAGHVLGSSVIQVTVNKNGEQRVILFSGDMGRPNRPIIHDADVFERADYVLIESTYGDRVHKETEDTQTQIANCITETVERGGKIIVPSFALERSQEILYFLNELIIEKRITHIPIYLDSPMASKITEVFMKHPELFDETMREHLRNGESPFKQTDLRFVESTDESKSLNFMKEPMIIIAGSGMCTGGRIKHHLVNNISDPKNTVMFVGYQAVGTLGRRILDGDNPVRILGEQRDIKAAIVKISGFSAHADRNELLAWLKQLKQKPREVFVVHGELKGANKFADYVSEQTGWQVSVPRFGDSVELE